MYNLTQLTTAETAGDLVLFSNYVTGGLFVGLMVIALFFISLFVLKRWEFDQSLLASAFISFLISAILSYGGILRIIYPLAFLSVAAFTFLYMVMTGK